MQSVLSMIGEQSYRLRSSVAARFGELSSYCYAPKTRPRAFGSVERCSKTFAAEPGGRSLRRVRFPHKAKFYSKPPTRARVSKGQPPFGCSFPYFCQHRNRAAGGIPHRVTPAPRPPFPSGSPAPSPPQAGPPSGRSWSPVPRRYSAPRWRTPTPPAPGSNRPARGG